MIFDLDRLEVRGEPVPVLENVMTDERGAVSFGISDNGSLVYRTGPLAARRTLVWVDRKGHEERLAVEPRRFSWPRVSPTGDRVALEVTDNQGNQDIWIYELGRQTAGTRLTFNRAFDNHPMWLPDGRRVVFGSRRDGGGVNLFWKTSEGTGQAERLTADPNPDRTAFSATPDGKNLVVVQVNPETEWDLHLLSMESDHRLRPLLQTQFLEASPVISPNGHWIAYRSDETGQMEVYVRPFPNVESGFEELKRLVPSE
jgi:Tol biopolymer transport system component